MVWLEVSIETDGEAAEAVAEALRPLAYQNSVALEQRGDETSLDPEALEPQVTVKIYVPEDEDTPAFRRRVEEILYHLNRLYPVPAPVFRHLAEADWANAWKDHYHPFRVGRRLMVRPSWWEEEERETGDWRPETERLGDWEIGQSAVGSLQSQVSSLKSHLHNPGDVVITLDPGMAFGTGLHPTTQSCMQALEDVVRPGITVLDVGTGSGILAITAARLGAAVVLGVDTDTVAVRTAVENVTQNGVGAQIQIRQGSLSSVPAGEWDVVVVNILATVIIQLLANSGLMSYAAPTGYLVLSGIIDQQAADVQAAIEKSGGRIMQTLAMRDWVTYVVQHRDYKR